jgi:hypothetical protein
VLADQIAANRRADETGAARDENFQGLAPDI